MLGERAGLSNAFTCPRFSKLESEENFTFPGQILRTNGENSNEITVKGVLDQAVQLECGQIDVPIFFVWNFVKVGLNKTRIIAFSSTVGSVQKEAAVLLGDVSLINSTLVIDHLQTAAEGSFTCQICYDEDGGDVINSFYINLIVLVPISKPLLQINNSAVVEGSPVALSCTLKNGTAPIEYFWYRMTVQEGTVAVAEITGSIGVLTAANRTHAGWYSCKAKNEVNEVTSDRVYLDVIYGPDEPVINIQPFAVTENGFSANEQEEVTMTCLASSNPPSHYVWFYNNSQIFSGQMYVISKISRTQTGSYTCLAQNTHLNTRTQITISLTVYYLPDGNPTCTAIAHNTYQDVVLWCSWDGGLPPAKLRWLKSNQEESDIVSYSNATKIEKGIAIRNESTYACKISHPALKNYAICRVTVWVPEGGPNCSAIATKQNELIMLTCELEGGLPQVTLLWTDWKNGTLEKPKDSTHIHALKSNTTYNGKTFSCTALHPLNANARECHVTLEIPRLDTQRNSISVFDGGMAQLSCFLKSAQPTSEMFWYNNKNVVIVPDSQKYGILQEGRWSNLTIRDTAWSSDSGTYKCSAFNAVGNSNLSISLQVKKYPNPPNVTISKLMYTRQRTEVDLEWMTQGRGNLTGFMVQRRVSKRSSPQSAGKVDSWDIVASDIQPEIRGHKLGGLNPAVVYAFRILAVNHRTTGFPSEVKTPADPPFNAYPAVIGAAVVGMLVAAVASLLGFQYIVRNRENNPRLHDLFFRPAHAEARERINIPEDAETSVNTEDRMRENADTAPAPAPAAQLTPEAILETATTAAASSQLSAADSPDDVPVNVTITVTAAS
ncbi:V-set and immunoglobulin domain-containing protein 10-like 2 [Rhinatrema bivittatum]|uniref:V-set and immunoglobulin domain-containing protein 10-like 2 n=1 Tax=Rhinatrema bivittatum TaxID=194408 RepID=UPI00112DF0D1|nr:V-set and immunoglobulin domain-containing protein 10-like 2 [Rhinatrema bivittatum]